MSWGALLLWLATAAAGGAATGLVRLPLRVEERLALAAVAGMVGSSAITLLLSLVAGFGAVTALLGPVGLLALCVAAIPVARVSSPLEPWRRSWEETGRSGWPELWAMGVITAAAALAFGLLFAHTLFERGGGIVAGYATVWADWSLHSTLASSFSQAGNMPPHDPVFSGTILLYPFLPDFHAATLEAVGSPIGPALAVPQIVLCTAITVLVVSLARRLAGSMAVGVVAVVICVLGGGIGFTGVVWDACRSGAGAGADCTVAALLTQGSTRGQTLTAIPDVVAHMERTRSYDNLQPASDSVSLGDTYQWYTPLLAWWLPQRTFIWGFAIGLGALLLVVVALRAPPGQPGTRSAFVAAGLLLGSLPLVHVHSLIAVGVVLALMAWRQRRPEWLWLLGAGAVVALPRVGQLLAGSHGVAAACDGVSTDGGTHFPFLQPGWVWARAGAYHGVVGDCYTPGRFDVSVAGAARAAVTAARIAVTPGFWGFWVANVGAVVIVSLLLGLAVLGRGLPAVPGPSRGATVANLPRTLATRLAGAVPADLLGFCLPFFAVFLVANLVVFQEWDWDNTKLLAWWYLAGALLTGALAVGLWRRGPVRAILASLVLVSVLLAGVLSLGRVAETESRGVNGGPYSWASPSELRLAEGIEARTSGQSVVLTHSQPTDPISTLAGRPAVMGYEGWLISYGIDLQDRPADAQTIFAGCSSSSQCAVPGLLARYHIDYVEIRDGGAAPDPGAAWFAQRYPLVVRSEIDGISVYDVRRP